MNKMHKHKCISINSTTTIKFWRLRADARFVKNASFFTRQKSSKYKTRYLPIIAAGRWQKTGKSRRKTCTIKIITATMHRSTVRCPHVKRTNTTISPHNADVQNQRFAKDSRISRSSSERVLVIDNEKPRENAKILPHRIIHHIQKFWQFAKSRSKFFWLSNFFLLKKFFRIIRKIRRVLGDCFPIFVSMFSLEHV